jgi:hypothetical protein
LSKKKIGAPNDTLFLHVPYYPANPPLHKIKETFQDILLYPQAATPLLQIKNLHEGIPCKIRKLIINYLWPPSLSKAKVVWGSLASNSIEISWE